MQYKELIDSIYISTKDNTDGTVADYFPQLAKVNPDIYGVSIFDIKGDGGGGGGGGGG